MHFIRRILSPELGRHHQCIRTLYEGVSSIICPRDRALDYAVERERRLKPILNLKNFIISDPSKSVPLFKINQFKRNLEIPTRPIEYIRRYPSIFQEIHPTSLDLQPHIKLSPEMISLNSEEDLLYQSVNYKKDVAVRLLKLLMISKVNKIPISLLERFKWELGLPQDYEKILIPEFPDYFRVINRGKELELVCWSDEFAVSEMEKSGGKDGSIQFCLHNTNGAEKDPKYKKWVDEWQKLPYISPYENAVHLPAKSNESDKWAVGVLHELLNLFVGKKVERETLFWLGEYLGMRSRFKVAFLQHPGIFYVSTKIGTHTVVLRDGYKRGMLIERHDLLDMRFKYVSLLNVVKDEDKSNSKKEKSCSDVNEGDVNEGDVEDSDDDEEGEDEDNVEMYDSSDDDERDDDDESDEEIVSAQDKSSRIKARRPMGTNIQKIECENSTRFSKKRDVRGDPNEPRRFRKNIDDNKIRSGARKTYGRSSQENDNVRSTRSSRNTNIRSDRNDARSSRSGRTNHEDGHFSRRRDFRDDPNKPRRSQQNFDDQSENASKRGKFRNNFTYEKKSFEPNAARRTYGRSSQKNEFESSTRVVRRNTRDGQNVSNSPKWFDMSTKWRKDRAEKTRA